MARTFAEFQETMTLALPDVRDRVEGIFGESKKSSSSHGLVVELAAIHEGLTSNFNNYTAEELEAALASWVSPYPKPILINHDLSVDPLGRVMAAKMDREDDGTYYTRLQVAVTDPAAMARVADKRYLTGSVGGVSKEAICSVCSTNWNEASTSSLPCKHTRGKTYKGKLAFLERKGLGFKEYSFVNAPADAHSGVRDDTAASEGDGNEWVRSARIFDLNMNKQEIMEFGESENRSVLQDLRNKEATPMYLQLKGAFLTALSAEAAELGVHEESSAVDEDILALSEELSDDLKMVAGNDAASDSGDEEDGQQEEAPTDANDEGAQDEDTSADEGAEASDETLSTEGAEEASETTESDDDQNEAESDNGGQEGSVEESDVVDANEPPVDTTANPTDTSRLAPKRARSGEARAEANEKSRMKNDPNVYSQPMIGDAGTQRRGIETDRKDFSRESEEENSEGTELNEAATALERRVSELEERESALLEENTRLKRALHRTLAERVVDGKIALGLHEMDEREALMTEHADRSASSLADNLRDLAKMTLKRSTDPSELPTLEQKSLVTAKDKDNALEAVIVEHEETNEMDPEAIFTDVLMGRRKLN